MHFQMTATEFDKNLLIDPGMNQGFHFQRLQSGALTHQNTSALDQLSGANQMTSDVPTCSRIASCDLDRTAEKIDKLTDFGIAVMLSGAGIVASLCALLSILEIMK